MPSAVVSSCKPPESVNTNRAWLHKRKKSRYPSGSIIRMPCGSSRPNSCNRVRVTCTGTLFMCLGQEDAADLRAPLRASEANDLLDAAIDEAITRKPKGHDFVIDRRR